MIEFKRHILVAFLVLFISGIIYEASASVTSAIGIMELTKSTIPSCHLTKRCFGVKAERSIDDDAICVSDCDYIVKFHPNLEGSIRFELFSTRPFNNRYMAVGISKDEKMGNDLVVVCHHDPSKVTQVSGYLSWNRGNVNHRLKDQSALKFVFSKFVDKLMLCRFEIPISIRIGDTKYDFNATNFHLLLAGGKVEKGYIKYHEARIATTGLSFASRLHLNTTSADYGAQNIHAAYMMLAWFFWIPCGMFTSRFYKETWYDSYMWSKRFWFIIHTGCMVFALVMALTAYVLVSYDRDTLIPQEFPVSIHGILGLVGISLLLLQCLLGWFRPERMVPREVVAKIHCYTGITCYLAGISNIILAPYFTNNVLPCGMTVVGILWLMLHLFFALMISSFIFWTDWHLQIGGWRAFCGCPMPIASNEEAVRPNLRKAVLGLFFLISVVFAFVGMASMKGVPCPPMFSLECSTNTSLL